MNNLCEKMHDKMADYVLGVINQDEIEALDKHISQCPRCREYNESLQSEKRSLLQLGRNLDKQMDARETKVIEALNQLSPERIQLLSIWRTIMQSRITRIAAAAVVIIAILLMGTLVLLFVHNGQDNAMISPVMKSSVTGPIELVKLSSLNVAYKEGGIRAVEEQFDRANRLMRIHSEEISLKELLEQLNGKQF